MRTEETGAEEGEEGLSSEGSPSEEQKENHVLLRAGEKTTHQEEGALSGNHRCRIVKIQLRNQLG